MSALITLLPIIAVGTTCCIFLWFFVDTEITLEMMVFKYEFHVGILMWLFICIASWIGVLYYGFS